jgi:hypothetical protein
MAKLRRKVKMKSKATAFAVIGDRYHNSDYIRTALGKTLAQDMGLSIDFTDEVKLLSAETLASHRMLIIFRDAAIWPDGYGSEVFWSGSQTRKPLPVVSDPPVPERKARSVDWMTEEQGRAVEDFVKGGGAALLYHNVTYIAAENQHFRDVLGAATCGHPPVRPFKIQITDPDHPITQGVEDFIVTDEQHFMIYDKDPSHVFMKSINEDGLTHRDMGTSCEAGWAYDYGNGRVCYLAPGHSIPALWNPEYEKVQHNAVRWLLRDI